MAAQVFWADFYSSRWPNQIGPTADFDGAAIPLPIFSMDTKIRWSLYYLTPKIFSDIFLFPQKLGCYSIHANKATAVHLHPILHTQFLWPLRLNSE